MDDTSLADLEEARAILAAQLKGETIDQSQMDENVLNAMSLIAQGYQSDSEEEGEVDHDSLKHSFIETKIHELATKSRSKSGSEQASQHGEVVDLTQSPSRDKKRKFKEKKRSRSRDRTRHRSKSNERARRERQEAERREREKEERKERQERLERQERREQELRERRLREARERQEREVKRRRTPSPFR